MKIISALAAAAGLTAALLTALPAYAVDEAPTNLKLSWKAPGSELIVVSWDEATPVSNVISLRKRGETAVYETWTTTADQPNSVEIWNAYIADYGRRAGRDAPLEFVVSAGSPGPEAVSAGFDANTPQAPQRVSSTLAASGAMTVEWKSPTWSDTTPNDPLDLNLPVTFQVTYDPANSSYYHVKIGGRTTVTQVTYTLRSAYSLNVTAYNEWNDVTTNTMLSTFGTSVTAKVPVWAVYNRKSAVTGTYTPGLRAATDRAAGP